MSARSFTAAILAAVLFNTSGALPAQSQDKTPASAFAFVQTSMGDGSWTGSAEHCVEPNNCSEGFGYQITSVQVAKGTYCGLRFTLKTDNPPYRVTRDINLMKNFEIDDSPRTGGITFNGPVMLSNGETRDSWFATTSNYETIMRVTKALKFLQSSCKPASPW